MGFNKCFLPNVDVLKKEFDKVGLELFIKRYNKCDAMFGDSDSFRFLEDKQKEYGLQQILKSDIYSKDTNEV